MKKLIRLFFAALFACGLNAHALDLFSAIVTADSTSQPLRLVSPYNGFAPAAGSVAAGTQLTMRLRMPFYIGSGNATGLVFSFDGWRMSSAGVVNLANPFSVLKVAVEKDGSTSSQPVLFGGGRSLTVNPGDISVKSDTLRPSAFGLPRFTWGDKYWIRLELSVASAGLVFPRGITTHLHYGYPASLSVVIDPAVFNGGEVDGYGPITTGSAGGWSQYPYGYIPNVLGYFEAGDPKTIIGLGDSIISGVYALQNGLPSHSGYMQALFDADLASNPIGGLNAGMAGASAGMWSGASAAYLAPYLAYAKYAVEEFGTNSFNSGTPTDPTVAMTASAALWTAMIDAGIEKILKPYLLPRTDVDGVTPQNVNWGDIRPNGGWAYNALLAAASGFPAQVQVINNNSLRLSSTPATTDYYSWAGGGLTNTVEGTHPNVAGQALEALDYRAAFGAFLP